MKGRIRAEGGEEGRPSEEDLLVRSNSNSNSNLKNSWPCHVAPAVGTLLEAHERVVKTLCWGYTHGLLRTFAKSRSLGPAKRSLRSMVTTIALHERVVNTLRGLHSRFAPDLYPEPIAWSSKAFVAKHGVHNGST